MKITLELINSFTPCYNPEDIGFTKDLELTPLEFIEQFEEKVESKDDIFWLLCRNEFMSDKDLRLFAVWCAREALKLIENPDKRSIEACNVAEKYANGEATVEQLAVAMAAAMAARADVRAPARAAAGAVAMAVAMAARAARAAAMATARATARAAVMAAQINKLKEYFN